MTEFNFDLSLIAPEDPSALHADEFLDRVEDALFEAFEGDVTPAVSGGVPMLYCTIVAESIGEALDRVADAVLKMDLHPAQLLMRLPAHDRYAPA